MNDAIAPKWSSLTPGLVEAMIFLKLNMSLISNNRADVTQSSIWNTVTSSRPELPYAIEDANDNENIEDDEDDDLSPVLVKSEEADRLYVLNSNLSISLCNNMKFQNQPTAIQPNIYIVWFRSNELSL